MTREEVKIAFVPQIDGLHIQDLMNYAKANPAYLKYLPD
jgi:hypothetical protein